MKEKKILKQLAKKIKVLNLLTYNYHFMQECLFAQALVAEVLLGKTNQINQKGAKNPFPKNTNLHHIAPFNSPGSVWTAFVLEALQVCRVQNSY